MEDQGLHHQEACIPGESQSQIQDTQTIDHVTYQDNIEDRRRLFQDIQEVDYLEGADPDRYEKVSKERFTKEVWALYWVAPYDEVILARERIRRGQIKSWNMRMFLRNVTERLPMVMYLERAELVNKHFGDINCVHLLFGGKKAWEYEEALASAGLRGPPPDPILTDLRKRAIVMVFLLEAAQAGHVTDDILEEEAVRALASSQDPYVMEAHFQEIRRIHELQWEQKKREERAARNNSISYLDNVLARQDILKQIQEAEYPEEIPITNSTTFEKLNRRYFTKEVWSALWVAPFEQLQQLSLQISRQEIKLQTMWCSLLLITDLLPDVIDTGKHNESTDHGKGLTNPVFAVINRKYDDNTNTPRVQPSDGSLGTEHNQVAHAFPQKIIEHAPGYAARIRSLAFVFGEQKVKEYTDALRSGYLESPVNLITLDEGIHTMWDQCKVTLRVKSFNENEVNLALHYLKDSKLGTRSRGQERYRWENDFTVTPADVLDFTDTHVISTATQQQFHDGFTFKAYAEDPKLRPDPTLLDVRDKLAAMASLLGAAEYMDDDDSHSDDGEGTRQPVVDEDEDYESVDGDVSDMGEDLYMEGDNCGYDSDE
ncbi:hypothetical protein CKAH01_17604 [Colletotrichum kahawae]|uniref:HNH nuclease domain-containing protein n=1 Tax=Colletotrichum kahawae TaxID=34407 RepID=A0AAE0D4L9_COLKA|nr:hypothetical protein CKAH01_17604 [Colletotrichum kahawae]